MQDNQTNEQRFSILFNKYLKGKCTKNEAEEILSVLENPDFDTTVKSEAFRSWNSFTDYIEDNVARGRILSGLHQLIQESDNGRFNTRKQPKRFIQLFYRVAAVLFIPVFIYAGYLTINYFENKNNSNVQSVWQTIHVAGGVQSEFTLPDGSRIWLNSGSVFRYPDTFVGNIRQVELSGEGYFDIATDIEHPFIVNTRELNVEVKGTQFVVIDYPDDHQIEVILEKGGVSLFKGDCKERNLLALINPGEKITYDIAKNVSSISKVDVDKYTAWKDGILIFRDDPIKDVAKQLSRRFNVDIELAGPGIEEYIYTATFKHETLIQILDLLKISAPIKYIISNQKVKEDNSYSKQKITILKIT